MKVTTNLTRLDSNELNQVRDFWDKASCGEIYAEGNDKRQEYDQQRRKRYELEPYLIEFAKFPTARDKDVLEIGVGMGADHQSLSENNPKNLHGIDLTGRAIEHVKERFQIFNLSSKLEVGNAELLPYADQSFDFIYSWGVIHHSPNTIAAVKEIHRVLRNGGIARVMIYHRYSIVGFMLWVRYALLKGRINTNLDEIYSKYLESPGTKAYTTEQAIQMFSDFSKVNVSVRLSFGDLLKGEVGQRHKGFLLSLAKTIWPRKIIMLFSKYLNLGLCLLIEAEK